MKIALAGTGAFGIKHLDGLANIDGVTVTSVVSRRLEQAERSRTSTASATPAPTWTRSWPVTTWTR